MKKKYSTVVNRRNIDYVVFGCLLLVGLLFLIQTKSNYTIDDAYITFRYSKNLASGNGMVWNPGGAHTQGYTNFLFMLIIAFGYKLSIPPLIMAQVFNYIGLLLICSAGYFILGKFNQSIIIKTLYVLTIFFYPVTLPNVNSGLETVFWTGLIFWSIYLLNGEFGSRRFCLFLSVLVAATLTRLETIFFAFVFMIILFFRQDKNKVFRGFTIYSIVIIGYLLFNYLYFGAITPNSALIKIADPLNLPGLFYLILTFQGNKLLILLTVFILLLVILIQRKNRKIFLLFIPFTLLVPFYLLTQPLMGMYNRFFYPLLMGMILFISIGLLIFLNDIKTIINNQELKIHDHVGHSIFLKFFLPVLLYIPLLSLLALGVSNYINDLKNPFDQLLLNNEIKIGKQLSTFPYVDDIYFAYGDAGSIPYYSGVKFLDLVGINNNNIARYGKHKGYKWILDYVLNEEPDIIGFYTTLDGKIYNGGHGWIGAHYSELYALMIENNKYVYYLFSD